MKVVFPTCCGADARESFLVATISKTPVDGLRPNCQKKRFSTWSETWNPVDLFKIDTPERLKERQLAKVVKRAVRFLEAQGLKVS